MPMIGPATRRGKGAAGEGTSASCWSTSLQRPTAHRTPSGNIYLAVATPTQSARLEQRTVELLSANGQRHAFDPLAWSLARAPRVLASGGERKASGLPGYKLLRRCADFETHW